MIISKNTAPILLVSFLILSGCGSSDAPDKGKASIPLHQVEIVLAERRPVSHKQIVSGTLEAITSVRLYNEEGGRITEIPYFEGDKVEKGAVVISLDNDLIQAELDKATAKRQQSELDLKRLKKLLPRKLTSEEEVARALTAVNVAKAEEQLQSTRLARSSVKAPFTGVISQRNNEPGDTVSAHSHILSMIDPENLRAAVQISERWIPLVKLDDPANVLIDALGDQLHSGYISRIHPTIDPSTRKGIIEVKLDPVPENATAGQLARVYISSQATDKLVIPSGAVHHDMDGAYAYILNKDEQGNNIVVKHKIIKGSQYGKWMEILSGVIPGDQVVVKGFLGLRNNKKVRAIESKAYIEEDSELSPTRENDINSTTVTNESPAAVNVEPAEPVEQSKNDDTLQPTDIKPNQQ